MTEVGNGLTDIQVAEKRAEFGENSISEQKNHLVGIILKQLLSPISLMLLLAAGLSWATGKTFDGDFIFFLFLVNQVITITQEFKADKAIQKLNDHLTHTVDVRRNNVWVEVSTRELVPGDLVKLSIGEVVPADGTILEGHLLTVDESSLTGESLPVEKSDGDVLYSGSFVSTGQVFLEVTAIGDKTYFGKTLGEIETSDKKSAMEQDVLSISKFLTTLSLLAVLILTVILIWQGSPWSEIITLSLSLIIAGIPISLPTVMTLIIEVGVLGLAAKQVVVRRLSALEDVANVNLLLTDKTGTLTQNLISVKKTAAFDGYSQESALLLAAVCAAQDPGNPINDALLAAADMQNLSVEDVTVGDFKPADSVRKHVSLTITEGKKRQAVILGEPQTIAKMTKMGREEQVHFNRQVEEWAELGYRTLALATSMESKSEKDLVMAGLFALSDSLRPESPEVIHYLNVQGVETVMVTGDNRAIGDHIADELDLPAETVVAKDDLDAAQWQQVDEQFYHSTACVAEIRPDDKYRLVTEAKKYYVVASTGDGVNDLPAVKEANVGIAVSNALEALKASADIVLLSPGISVIRDMLIESRKIYARIYAYSVYRISESLRLILTVAILGVGFGAYPLTQLQLIMLALLNDMPIISLAVDRVRLANKPAHVDVRKRFYMSSLLGLSGVANSLLMVWYLMAVMHAPWPVIQTLYFLKLSIGGHLLLFVARTRDWWFRYLPAKPVIAATLTTQVLASILGLTGWLMPAALSWQWLAFIWVWALMWMQVSEAVK